MKLLKIILFIYVSILYGCSIEPCCDDIEHRRFLSKYFGSKYCVIHITIYHEQSNTYNIRYKYTPTCSKCNGESNGNLPELAQPGSD